MRRPRSRGAAGAESSSQRLQHLLRRHRLPRTRRHSRRTLPASAATRGPRSASADRHLLAGCRSACHRRPRPRRRAGYDAQSNRSTRCRRSSRIFGLATEFTALARTGSIDRLRSRRILSGLSVAVADDAVILDLNGAPDFLRPVIALIAGSLLALLAFWPLPPPSGTAVVPETSVLPATHETTFVEASETFAPQALARAARRRSTQVSLPRLLLLALAVDKGPEAIETAPPLGSRLEVTEILSGVIQDLAPAETQNVLARRDGFGPDRSRPARSGSHGGGRRARRGRRRARQGSPADDRLARLRAEDRALRRLSTIWMQWLRSPRKIPCNSRLYVPVRSEPGASALRAARSAGAAERDRHPASRCTASSIADGMTLEKHSRSSDSPAGSG